MSDYVKLNDTIYVIANFYHPLSGYSMAADTTPAWLVYEDNGAGSMLTGSMTARTNVPGVYYGSFVASAANGFETGKFYDVQVSGVVWSTRAYASVKQFTLGEVYDSNVVRVSGVSVYSDMGDPTQIANRVLDDSLSQHQTIGSVGYALNVASGNLIGITAAPSTADIWTYTTRTLTSFPSGAFADAVWDTPIVDHQVIGTTGYALNAASGNFIGSTGGDSAATIWAYADRTLTSYPSGAFADAVWDEVLTGSSHNATTTAGRRLRELAGNIIYAGTAVSSTANTITLDSGASSVSGSYDPSMIAIVNGTGAGQCRLIYEYNGFNKAAVVDRNWKIPPDGTSEFVIYANPGREHVNEGLARGGSINSITLNIYASDIDDSYHNQMVFIRSGTGEDQARIVSAYNGTSKIATVSEDWSTVPDTTSAYVMLPYHIHELNEIWSYTTRSLTTAVSVSGVPDVNIVSVSGVYTSLQTIVDANIVQVSGQPFSLESIIDANVVNVSGLPVSINDFHTDISGLDQDVYFAAIKYVADGTNNRDEFAVHWFKNDQPVSSGSLTNPRISVYNTADGSALFAGQAMTYASPNVGVVRYNTVTTLLASGEPYLIEASGTIDSAMRTWRSIVGVDLL